MQSSISLFGLFTLPTLLLPSVTLSEATVAVLRFKSLSKTTMQLLCLNCAPFNQPQDFILPLQPLRNFPSQSNGGEECADSAFQGKRGH